MAQDPLTVSTVSIACQIQFARFKGVIIFYNIVLRKSIYYGREITCDLGFLRMLLEFYLSEPENEESFKESCYKETILHWVIHSGVTVLDPEHYGVV